MGKLCTLYVDKKYRGTNIGNTLIQISIENIRSEDIFCTVSGTKLKELMPILTSNGFQHFQTIPDMYKLGEQEHFFKL